MHTCHDLHGTKIISIGELIKKKSLDEIFYSYERNEVIKQKRY